jgi:hypothetical protein
MKSQALVNYMGELLDVEFAIVANHGSRFDAQLTLHNTGSEVLAPPHAWALYFYTQRRPYAGGSSEKMAWRDVKQGGVRIRHVQGSLFEISPTEEFGTLHPHERKTVELTIQWCIASRTDMYPNWYVAVPSEPSVRPVVLRATTSESLSYFAALTETNQVKRSPSDQHLPWTPQQRFLRNTPQGNSDPEDPKGNVKTPDSDQVPMIPPLVPTPKEYSVVEDASIVFDERWAVCDTRKEFSTHTLNLLASKQPHHLSVYLDRSLIPRSLSPLHPSLQPSVSLSIYTLIQLNL